MSSGLYVTRHTAIILLALVTLLAPVFAQAAADETVRVNLYQARLGPVYQRLADGRVIEVTIYVTYPDKLIPLGPGKGLGKVNFTVVTNWTGLWDGILTVMVVDPGYRIDNTTFKPVESVNAWASGGAVLGSGNIHVAGSNVVSRPVANVSAVLWPHTRFVKAEPGRYDAQYFFKARLALFDENGGKVLGGDILVYTTSDAAPHVVVIKPEKQVEAVAANAGEGLLMYLFGVTIVVVAAYLVSYFLFSKLYRRR